MCAISARGSDKAVKIYLSLKVVPGLGVLGSSFKAFGLCLGETINSRDPWSCKALSILDSCVFNNARLSGI